MESVDDDGMADRLKRARERRYGTATEAAKALNIAEPTYLAHENGSRGFWKKAPEYARHFRVRLQWLLTGIGPMEHKSVIEDRFEALSPESQREALRYLDYLASKDAE